ncbi:hypothetical protein Ahy_B10g104321 [Arachis hypogaea]|uniref:MULE transposase domain-containing protein n=1 Tax=Arachis hypogaea TaxID=3818 RepID=A0A444X5F9_ARAHY|nr:hypothetical protein Ahy_B10g104321 [Arachis hypogaea]
MLFYLIRFTTQTVSVHNGFFFWCPLQVQFGFWFFCGCESPWSVDTSWMYFDENYLNVEYWLCCMGGKSPKRIFTDQCASIQRAIETCMPTTIHRWCIWHIMKKILHKLNSYKRHEEIEQEMSHVIWNLFTKEAFDRN